MGKFDVGDGVWGVVFEQRWGWFTIMVVMMMVMEWKKWESECGDIGGDFCDEDGNNLI